MTSRKIAVLFHERDRDVDLSGYQIDHIADFWREDGHEVEYVFGTSRHVPADIVFVHVNLSVVPPDYVEYAAAYPRSVNARITDIRKSAISPNLVRRGDAYDGPVIVKSDLNFGGQPEQAHNESPIARRSRLWRRALALRRQLGRPTIRSWTDYVVYESMAEVDDRWFDDPSVVVEKFLPERDGGLYHLRMYQFLGDRWGCSRISSPSPLIKAHSSISSELVQPHPDVVRWREALQMDFGKLDYVLNDGHAVLLDANKTVGASKHVGEDELRAARRNLAEGLYSYF